MLLRFAVSNFGSIRDRQELSMIAAKAIKDDDSGLIETPALRNEKVLPAAVIYGANASGKSNLLKAFGQAQALIRNSHRYGRPGADIRLKPFLLDSATATEPFKFELDFVTQDARYSYGFEAKTKSFTNEYLYTWASGARARLFERVNNKFVFGRGLKGENKTIERLTRPNSLFISAAKQNNHELLTAIYNYIVGIYVCSDRYIVSGALAKRLAQPKFDAYIRMLNLIDVGITAIRIKD